MQVKELLRAFAAFAVFSLGIALFLVSVIVVVAALTKSPLFAVAGFGGMIAASLILQVANTKIAPHHLSSTITSK